MQLKLNFFQIGSTVFNHIHAWTLGKNACLKTWTYFITIVKLVSKILLKYSSRKCFYILLIPGLLPVCTSAMNYWQWTVHWWICWMNYWQWTVHWWICWIWYFILFQNIVLPNMVIALIPDMVTVVLHYFMVTVCGMGTECVYSSGKKYRFHTVEELLKSYSIYHIHILSILSGSAVAQAVSYMTFLPLILGYIYGSKLYKHTWNGKNNYLGISHIFS